MTFGTIRRNAIDFSIIEYRRVYESNLRVAEIHAHRIDKVGSKVRESGVVAKFERVAIDGHDSEIWLRVVPLDA